MFLSNRGSFRPETSGAYTLRRRGRRRPKSGSAIGACAVARLAGSGGPIGDYCGSANIVDHDRGCLIWAHEGTGKDVLNLFLDELTREQRRAIEVVTADGARWIRQLVKRRCPNARWVMDPFHVVQWMNDALDAVRCEEWNAARAAARAARPRPEGKRGRPAKGELPPEEVRALEEEAASIKGSRYALVKNPEDLTDGQRARLEALKKRAGSRLVRAWELKEDLRAVFRAADGCLT